MHSDIRELLEAFFKDHADVEAVRWYQSPEEGISNVYAKPDSEDEIVEGFTGDYEDGFFGPFDFLNTSALRADLFTLTWNVENVLEGTVTKSEMVEVSADLVEHREPFSGEKMGYEDETRDWTDPE